MKLWRTRGNYWALRFRVSTAPHSIATPPRWSTYRNLIIVFPETQDEVSKALDILAAAVAAELTTIADQLGSVVGETRADMFQEIMQSIEFEARKLRKAE